MSNTVEILVKNPSGEGDSLVVIPLASSILDLKHRISQQHPKRPDVASQRLIFSGRILRDDDVLQNIFNPNITNLSLDVTPYNDKCRTLWTEWCVLPFSHSDTLAQPQFMYQQGPVDPNAFPPNYQNPNMYPGNYNPHAPPVAGPVFHAQVHRAGFALNIDFSLVIKLILLVYVLGQDRPPQVLAALAVAALAYYLYNTAIRFRIFGGQDQAPPQQPQQQQQQQQRQGPNQDGNNNNNGNGAQQADVQPNYQQDIPWYTRDNAGFTGEIFRFVIPLGLSLFPGWTFPDNLPDRSQPQTQPARGAEQGQ